MLKKRCRVHFSDFLPRCVSQSAILLLSYNNGFLIYVCRSVCICLSIFLSTYLFRNPQPILLLCSFLASIVLLDCHTIQVELLLWSLKKFQVTNSFSVSGGYAGFKASASVDINKFEESEESNKDFGEEQLTYNISGGSLPEPIQVTLMRIEETLTPTFWSNSGELKKKRSCKKMTLTKLGKFLRNMRQAIKQYPKEIHVKRAKGVYTIHILLDVINLANIFNYYCTRLISQRIFSLQVPVFFFINRV